MSKRHTITFEEMTAYLGEEGWHIAASSHGMDSSKKLYVSTKGQFRVTDRGETTYSGPSLGLAVDAYNNAP